MLFSSARRCVACVVMLWLVSASPALAAVAAPVLKWSYGGCSAGPYCQTGWYSSPAVADLDGDGQAEVVWGAYDVVALNGVERRPEVARRRAASASGRGWPSPT